jgi:hypothetical protein
MPLSREDVEQVALAIANVHGHPNAQTYAEAVGQSWADAQEAPMANAPSAPIEGDPLIPDA